MRATTGPRPSRRGRAMCAVMAMIAPLTMGACTTRAPASDADTTLGDARAAMRSRAQLLTTGDIDGYLDDVAPEARAAEEGIARGAAAVSLSFANLAFRPLGRPAPDAVAFRDVDVEVVYRYKGLPEDNLFRFSLLYDVERLDGVWTVTASTPGEEHPLPQWARASVEVTRSPHFLAIHRPGLTSSVRALELAEQARAKLAPRLEFGESDSVHLVFLAADHAEYQEIFGQPIDQESLAVAEADSPPLGKPESRRMTVNLEPFLGRDQVLIDGRAGRLGPVEVFQHELAHLALARVVGGTIPGWVNEGAAMYLAGERRTQDWRIGLDEGEFEQVALGDLSDKGDLADGVEYAYANATVLYLIEEFGVAAFWDFFINYRPGGDSTLLGDDPTPRLLKKAFELDEAELDRRTLDFMDREGKLDG